VSRVFFFLLSLARVRARNERVAQISLSLSLSLSLLLKTTTPPYQVSNADISAICQEAGMHAVRKNRYVILPKDFEKGEEFFFLPQVFVRTF
jgi:ATP-dependent 26S proteasome regulatory subunit